MLHNYTYLRVLPFLQTSCRVAEQPPGLYPGWHQSPVGGGRRQSASAVSTGTHVSNLLEPLFEPLAINTMWTTGELARRGEERRE